MCVCVCRDRGRESNESVTKEQRGKPGGNASRRVGHNGDGARRATAQRPHLNEVWVLDCWDLYTRVTARSLDGGLKLLVLCSPIGLGCKRQNDKTQNSTKHEARGGGGEGYARQGDEDVGHACEAATGASSRAHKVADAGHGHRHNTRKDTFFAFFLYFASTLSAFFAITMASWPRSLSLCFVMSNFSRFFLALASHAR